LNPRTPARQDVSSNPYFKDMILSPAPLARLGYPCKEILINADTGNRTRAEGLEGRFFSEKNLFSPTQNPHSDSLEFFTVNDETVNKYFSIREINGTSIKWIEKIKHWLYEYLDYIDFKISEKTTFDYLKMIKEKHSINFYRKKAYQIRKFLDYIGCSWCMNIKPPQESHGLPKRMTDEDISQALEFFHDHEYVKQFSALIKLGADSGMRAEELFQLREEDIDLDNRLVSIHHKPELGLTTKTGRSRVSFFTEETRVTIKDYLTYYNDCSNLKILFSQRHCHRYFRNAPLHVKDLRKYFSQRWDRNNGNYHAKEMILGHSMNRVDFNHYSILDIDELKNIYDKVMGENGN